MRILFILLAVVIAFVAESYLSPHSPLFALLLGTTAYLLCEIFSLHRRIARLEHQLNSQQQASQLSTAHRVAPSCAAEEKEGTLSASSQVFRQPLPAPAHPEPTGSGPPHRPHPLASFAAPLLSFFTGGNPVLKVGLVVLFFGVAFLLKYAAQRNMLPIELRLTGVALGGLALLLFGWRLRRRHAVYGLGLEGGGIGILYLVVFAAAKLYHLLPLSLALAIMTGLVALSGLLAVLQAAQGLAVSGSIGGFLAPVLMASGDGNHVLLFSYYSLLNCGILGIAWFKAWRELNLVGFVFTFALFSLWAATSSSAVQLATTEPFLILFFGMYCLISVLFALRQPPKLRGFIDGPLVFGLPIVASSLQAYLMHGFRYGLAWSALALGLWYIGLARLLWYRFNDSMHLLTEAFLALGVVFASLSIPLGLDPQWTIGAWALEGAAMIWIGVRQDRPSARLFGLALQGGAAIIFLDQPGLPHGSLLFANRIFLGCALIAIAALLSGYWLDRLGRRVRRWEALTPLILLAWGLIWWYCGGLADLRRHGFPIQPETAFLLYVCGTSALLAWLASRVSWPRLHLALLVLVPMMIFVYTVQLLDGGPLLSRTGWLAWPLAFVLQYVLMYRCERHWPSPVHPMAHCLSLWLLLLVLTTELTWRVNHIAGLAQTWSTAMWGLVPTLLLYLLVLQGERLDWPVQRHLAVYRGKAVDIPVMALLLWCLASFALSGRPAPLPYIPLFNPLELIELAILLLAALRWLRGHTVWPRKGQLLLVALLGFAWLNVVTARSVHFFTGTAYRFDILFAAPVFQAAIAALWALLALSLTVWGARREQRTTWIAGASLLGLVVLKLFMIDLSGTGSIGRIISFLVVGLLMLVIGFFAPLPPKSSTEPSNAQ